LTSWTCEGENKAYEMPYGPHKDFARDLDTQKESNKARRVLKNVASAGVQKGNFGGT